MELADCWLYLGKTKSNTPLKNITPAELVLLLRGKINKAGNTRQDQCGTFPVHDLVVHSSVKRTKQTEMLRLRKYGRTPDDSKYTIEELYPGETAQLPDTFAETGFLVAAQAKLLGESVPAPDDAPPEEITPLIPSLVTA